MHGALGRQALYDTDEGVATVAVARRRQGTTMKTTVMTAATARKRLLPLKAAPTWATTADGVVVPVLVVCEATVTRMPRPNELPSWWAVFTRPDAAPASLGAPVAIDRDHDLVGTVTLVVVTTLGGGIVRDLVLGDTSPPAFQRRERLVVALAAAATAFVAQPRFESLSKPLLVVDAAGLGFLCAAGTEKAIDHGSAPCSRSRLPWVTGGCATSSPARRRRCSGQTFGQTGTSTRCLRWSGRSSSVSPRPGTPTISCWARASPPRSPSCASSPCRCRLGCSTAHVRLTPLGAQEQPLEVEVFAALGAGGSVGSAFLLLAISGDEVSRKRLRSARDQTDVRTHEHELSARLDVAPRDGGIEGVHADRFVGGERGCQRIPH
ncbi:hypothetical protein GTQ99_02325 [Kineococcus sp. T13]|nr:hypothetical protein [Kineococcus vitellinus]